MNTELIFFQNMSWSSIKKEHNYSVQPDYELEEGEIPMDQTPVKAETDSEQKPDKKVKVIDLEKYYEMKGPTIRKRKLEATEISTDEWAARIGLDNPPSPVDNTVLVKTFDVSIDACLADETVIDKFEEAKQFLRERNVTEINNSVASFYKEIPNKQTDPKKQYVIRINQINHFLPKDRVKPQTCDVGVQTNASLLPSRPRPVRVNSDDEDKPRKRFKG